MKDNGLQECLVLPIAGKKFHGEHSCTSRGRHLTPVLEDSGRTQLGKLEPALSCSWGRGPGGLTGTEGGGPTTLSHMSDWRPEATWCKIRHDGPSQSPFSSRPIHSPVVCQGWRIGCLRWAESLTSSFYTILNPVVFSGSIVWARSHNRRDLFLPLLEKVHPACQDHTIFISGLVTLGILNFFSFVFNN